MIEVGVVMDLLGKMIILMKLQKKILPLSYTWNPARLSDITAI